MRDLVLCASLGILLMGATEGELGAQEQPKPDPASMVRFGFSGGLAVSLLTPLVPLNDRMVEVGLAGIPYLIALPGYWSNKVGDPAREYCAAKWTGSTVKDAKEKALEHSRAEAVQLARLLIDNAQMLDATTCIPTAPDNDCVRYSITRSQLVFVKTNLTQLQNSASVEYKALIADLVSKRWKPDEVGKCGKYQWGPWIGLAGIPFSSLVRNNKNDETSQRTAIPIFAAGLGYSPNHYIALLGGVSYLRFEEPEDGGKTGYYNAISFMFGVGGSLDIFSSALKK